MGGRVVSTDSIRLEPEGQQQISAAGFVEIPKGGGGAMVIWMHLTSRAVRQVGATQLVVPCPRRVPTDHDAATRNHRRPRSHPALPTAAVLYRRPLDSLPRNAWVAQIDTDARRAPNLPQVNGGWVGR